MMLQQDPVDTGKTFFRGTSGKWASEKLMAALKAGRPLSTAELRTCDTLRKDEWIQLDNALIEEASIRLQGVADLLNAGSRRWRLLAKSKRHGHRGSEKHPTRNTTLDH